jgi:hypothetical protein
MNGQDILDAGSLERRARGLEEKEAITTIMERPGTRIIVGSRISDDGSAINFIEVTSFLDGELHSSYDEMMNRRRRMDESLRAIGCASYDDDLDRIWELVTSDERLATDLARVRSAVESALQADLLDPLGQ